MKTIVGFVVVVVGVYTLVQVIRVGSVWAARHPEATENWLTYFLCAMVGGLYVFNRRSK